MRLRIPTSNCSKDLLFVVFYTLTSIMKPLTDIAGLKKLRSWFNLSQRKSNEIWELGQCTNGLYV